MTVSSPPSRPEPDGGESVPGNVRSPPSPSNNENINTDAHNSGQSQSTVVGTGIQKHSVKQVNPSRTTQVEIQQENIQTNVKSNTENLDISNNETSGI